MLFRRPVRRVLDFLRVHPILCLLLLSPGIPEYISGSSALNTIFLNPVLFLFQIVANLGLYGPGVLLIREAMVRWRKGWATVLLLGAAYGILEEGIALSTLFDPKASPVGTLGTYGHWLGVNWVWLAGIIPVHMIFSISLPILLLGMALPETKGRSLLSSRGVTTALVILGFDVFFLLIFVVRAVGFWMGWPVFMFSLVAIGILVYSGHRAPADLLKARTVRPRRGPVFFCVAGLAFYTSVLLTENVGMTVGLPAALVAPLVVLVQALFLFCVAGAIGASGNERELLAFSLGLILSIAPFGVLAQYRLPLPLAADFIMILFFVKLWRNYARPDSRPASSPIP